MVVVSETVAAIPSATTSNFMRHRRGKCGRVSVSRLHRPRRRDAGRARRPVRVDAGAPVGSQPHLPIGSESCS
jgi:hypothetical protein